MIFQHLETISERGKIIVVGRTPENKSVAVILDNVEPFLIVSNYPGLEDEIDTIFNKKKLTNKIKKNVGKMFNFEPKFSLEDISNNISYEYLQGQDITNFSETKNSTFLKIKTSNIYDYYNIKKIVKGTPEQVFDESKGLSYTKQNGFDNEQFYFLSNPPIKSVLLSNIPTMYNDQVDPSLQHFIHNDWYSCSWFEIEASSSERKLNKTTTCDYECSGTLKPVQYDGVAPWRILSYDIESLPPPRGNTGKFDFPSAEKDPIITIAATLTMETLEKHVWMLCPDKTKEKDKLYDVDGFKASDAVVYTFDNEFKLICHFIQFCIKKDVDFIQGHNVNRFDNTYIIDRWNKLNPHENNLNWSRLTSHHTKVQKSSFSSSQKGTMEKFKLLIPGRVVLDSYDIMKDQHNESSYKLDNLAESYLGTKKVPMDYADIYPKYQTQEGRLELAVYCLKDAWLVHALLEKLCKLMVILQMANVTGISVKDVMDRGQGIRTIALMIRYAKKHNYFIPRVKPSKTEESFEGAVVVDPDVGHYKNAVSCLDFASLYPSIMQAMNMSYETLVSRQLINKMGWKEDVDVRTIPDYELINGKLKTTFNPNNPSFVTKETRVGLLTEMLETILAERKKVKKLMKGEKPHSTMYNVYNGRQLGLKVVANSIYGFTGASVGFLPCKTIASSVTKYGRGLTLKTKSIIENHPEWGQKHGCKCIYGDTDSVFVHMPRTLVDGKTKEELINNAHKMGEVMAEHVTKFFLKPVFLEYEKTYSPYLLLKKKRYAGMKYEPGLPPKLHLKGIEAVRRDFAPLLVDTQKKLLNAVIKEENIQKGCDIVHTTVKNLFTEKIPREMFIMSKKLSRPPSEYVSKAPHVTLALKMAKKDVTTAPMAGDRVEYVIFHGGGLVSNRACPPEDIQNGKHIIDREYYMEKQLRKPLMRILEHLVDNPKDYFKIKTKKKRMPTGRNMFASWVKKPKFT